MNDQDRIALLERRVFELERRLGDGDQYPLPKNRNLCSDFHYHDYQPHANDAEKKARCTKCGKMAEHNLRYLVNTQTGVSYWSDCPCV